MYSFIIPLYNSSNLELQLQNLQDLDLSGIWKWEFIFVNDASDSCLIQKLEKEIWGSSNFSLCSLPDISDPTLNRVCQARNLGAQHALGEILVFIDQDTILSQKYIDTIAMHSFSEWEVILWPYYGYNNNRKYISDECIQSYIQSGTVEDPLYNDFRIGHTYMFDQNEAWKYFCASNFLIYRRDFQHLDWFDESIISWWDEDVELWYRISRSMNITFVPDMAVLNISEKLYHPPFCILEDQHIRSLFSNAVKNFQKHASQEYLHYIIHRYNWLNQEQKKLLPVSCKKLIEWVL